MVKNFIRVDNMNGLLNEAAEQAHPPANRAERIEKIKDYQFYRIVSGKMEESLYLGLVVYDLPEDYAILLQLDRDDLMNMARSIIREFAPTGLDEIHETLKRIEDGLPPHDDTAL